MIWYCGIRNSCAGTIVNDRKTRKIALRSGKSSRANANAASEQNTSCPAVRPAVIRTVLSIWRPNGTASKTAV
jgi:hypothetical protein